MESMFQIREDSELASWLGNLGPVKYVVMGENQRYYKTKLGSFKLTPARKKEDELQWG